MHVIVRILVQAARWPSRPIRSVRYIASCTRVWAQAAKLGIKWDYKAVLDVDLLYAIAGLLIIYPVAAKIYALRS